MCLLKEHVKIIGRRRFYWRRKDRQGGQMDKIFAFLIKHKWIVIGFFAVVSVAALIGVSAVETNFDISAFMPENADSVEGSAIEEEAFHTARKAYVLLEDKENWHVLALQEDIKAMDGVKDVEWMDDMLDVYTPEAFLSEEALEKYKKGNATILVVELVEFDEEAVNAAITDITAMMQEGEYFGGQPVVLDELRITIGAEMPVYLIIAGAILIVLLAVSLSSYIAPLLCILNIGVAILLNYGTNFIAKNEVSFLTIAIAAVLQLAVSMDYSIFLIHRFEEEMEKHGGDTKGAMVTAMRTTLTAISSSALTDCAGFLALIFMHNQIGADLGIVLAKGVAISLVVSVTLLPCLMMVMHKLGKRRHRVLMPSLKKVAKPLVKMRYVLVAVVIVASVPMIIASNRLEYYYTTEDFMPDDTPPVVATRKIGETFGSTDAVNVIYKQEMNVFERDAMAEIEALPGVRETEGLSSNASLGTPELFLPDELKEAYIGGEYRRFSVTMERNMNNDKLFGTIDDIRAIADETLGESYVTGGHAGAADMASTAEWDNMVVELLTMAFIFVILLIAYRSLLVPVFLVLVIKAAIYINMGIGYFMGEELVFLTPVLVGAIQLGATVDYAILFTSRYFEFRHKAVSAKQAVTQTIAAASRPMMTSVLTFFFTTLSITIVSSLKATREITGVVGRGALISYAVIIFALPALFVLFDKPLRATTWEFIKARRIQKGSATRRSKGKRKLPKGDDSYETV